MQTYIRTVTFKWGAKFSWLGPSILAHLSLDIRRVYFRIVLFGVSFEAGRLCKEIAIPLPTEDDVEEMLMRLKENLLNAE